MSLHQIKNVVFNPLLQTRLEIETFLKSQIPETAHPFSNDILLFFDGTSVKEINISDKPSTFFIDNAKLNDLGDVLLERLQLHKNTLQEIVEYTLILPNDSIIEIPWKQDSIVLFALSIRQPTYYDLCIGNENGDVITYNSKKSRSFSGLLHSGDIIKNDTLLQTVRTDSNVPTQCEAVVFVSGYNYTQLNRYEKFRPSVLVANHELKLLYLTTIPLDLSSVGKATLCCPLVYESNIDGTIKIKILPTPPKAEQIFASGSSLPGATLSFQRSITISKSLQQEFTGMSTQESLHTFESVKKEEDIVSELLKDVEEGLTLIVENGCDASEIAAAYNPTTVLRYGLGLSVAKEYTFVNEEEFIFPLCLGNVLQGGNVLALGKPWVGSKVNVSKLIDEQSLGIIFVVSDKMSDQAVKLNPHLRCNNSLFILIPSNTKKLKFSTHKSLVEFMNNLNINSIQSLAGPCSFVVVKINSKYFFYRGTRIEGLTLSIPNFGDDVTDIVLQYGDHCKKNLALSEKNKEKQFSSLISLKEEKIIFNGHTFSVDDLFKFFDMISFEELNIRKDEVCDTFSQLSVLFSYERLTEITGKLLIKIKTRIDKEVAAFKKNYVDFVENNFLVERNDQEERLYRNEKNRLYSVFRGSERNLKIESQFFVDLIGNTISSRGSSSRMHNLNQLIRKRKIAANVSSSKEVTYDDLCDLLDEHCSAVGCVIGNLDQGNLPSCLQRVAAGENFQLNNFVTFDRRNLVLEGLDVGIVMNHHSGSNNQNMLTATDDSISFSLCIGNQLAIPWPLFDEFVELKNPYEVPWINICNEPHIAKLRILIRGTFSQSQLSREFAIPPASKYLGKFLLSLLLDLMCDLANSGRNNVSKFDDKKSQIMRGLFGQLFTLMASGGAPLCPAHYLLSMNSSFSDILPEDEWWIYEKIVYCFPYTCWDDKILKRNIAVLLVRSIRRCITDPVTLSMRKSIDQLKKNNLQTITVQVDKQLEFLQVAVEVIRRLNVSDEKHQKDNRLVAQRLLTRKPNYPKLNRGFGIVVRYLECIAEYGLTSQKQHLRVLQACFDMFCKRSGHFKDGKRKIIKGENKPEAAMDLISEAEKIQKAWFEMDLRSLQNYQTVEKIAADSEDYPVSNLIKSLKGDAELNRVSWKISKDGLPPKIDANFFTFVMTGNEKDETATTVTTTTESLSVVDLREVNYEQEVINKLTKVPNSSKAVDLIQRLKLLTFTKILELSKNDINSRIFLKLIGYLNKELQISEIDDVAFDFSILELNNEKNLREQAVLEKCEAVLKKIVLILLENWRDALEGEHIAAVCLT
ncbi:hypothetical protein HDU92_003596 [Lobulomyces angularis]|nr:hypothetical protein HDU92_003596 [Lobulomyces angularis]